MNVKITDVSAFKPGFGFVLHLEGMDEQMHVVVSGPVTEDAGHVFVYTKTWSSNRNRWMDTDVLNLTDYGIGPFPWDETKNKATYLRYMTENEESMMRNWQEGFPIFGGNIATITEHYNDAIGRMHDIFVGAKLLYPEQEYELSDVEKNAMAKRIYQMTMCVADFSNYLDEGIEVLALMATDESIVCLESLQKKIGSTTPHLAKFLQDAMNRAMDKKMERDQADKIVQHMQESLVTLVRGDLKKAQAMQTLLEIFAKNNEQPAVAAAAPVPESQS